MRLAWRASGLFLRMFPRSNSRTNCARCRYKSCRVTKTTISEAVAAPTAEARSGNTGYQFRPGDLEEVPQLHVGTAGSQGGQFQAALYLFGVQRFIFIEYPHGAPVIQGLFQVHPASRQLLLIKSVHDRFSHFFRAERVLARDQVSVSDYFRHHRDQCLFVIRTAFLQRRIPDRKAPPFSFRPGLPQTS